MNTIKLAGIVKQSITDGPGLRLTIFTQGCPHHCEGCHNPETWSFEGGKDYKVEDILTIFDANPLLRGITFSGGEPLEKAAELIPLAEEIVKRGKDIVCYTGFLLEDLLKENDENIVELLKLTYMLVDGPYIEEKRDLRKTFRGSSNQRLIDMQSTFLNNKISLFED